MFNFLNREAKAVSVTKSRDVIGCTGKMPLHSEFIKHNLKLREIVALDNWMLDGVTLMNRRYSENWKEQFNQAPLHNFVFTGAGDEHAVVGVIKPSSDKIGRSYPFSVFSATDTKFFKEAQALMPLAYHEFLSSVNQVVNRDWTQDCVSDLTAKIDALEPTLNNKNKRELIDLEMHLLKNVTMKEFWEEILPGADLKTRSSFVRTIMCALQSVARRSPQRVHWGVRFPLPGKAHNLTYVVFWLQLCESVLGGRTWRSHYFWNMPSIGNSSKLTVFFKQISASYFSQLIEPNKKDGSVYDVISEMEKENHDYSKMQHIIANESMTMLDALQQWRQREVVQ